VQQAKAGKEMSLRSRGRKRPLQEMTDGGDIDEVVLKDGRRGIFKRAKVSYSSIIPTLPLLTFYLRHYQGAYFYEHGRKEGDAVQWYNNPEELLAMPSMV
jgi:hypothetical protein